LLHRPDGSEANDVIDAFPKLRRGDQVDGRLESEAVALFARRFRTEFWWEIETCDFPRVATARSARITKNIRGGFGLNGALRDDGLGPQPSRTVISRK
jgi:hypothetical protein